MPDKKTYYISVARGEISQSSTDSPWDFKIEANDEEITLLREYFDQLYTADHLSFYRAHVPYVQYHFDRENDAYDMTLKKVYGMIYELGDEEARNHIENMGILDNNNKDHL